MNGKRFQGRELKVSWPTSVSRASAHQHPNRFSGIPRLSLPPGVNPVDAPVDRPELTAEHTYEGKNIQQNTITRHRKNFRKNLGRKIFFYE